MSRARIMYPVITSHFGALLTHEMVGQLLEQLEKAVEVLNVEIAKNANGSTKKPHSVSAQIESIAFLSDPNKSYQLSEVRLAVSLQIEDLHTLIGDPISSWSACRLVSYKVGDPYENQADTLQDIYQTPFFLVMQMYEESGMEKVVRDVAHTPKTTVA